MSYEVATKPEHGSLMPGAKTKGSQELIQGTYPPKVTKDN